MGSWPKSHSQWSTMALPLKAPLPWPCPGMAFTCPQSLWLSRSNFLLQSPQILSLSYICITQWIPARNPQNWKPIDPWGKRSRKFLLPNWWKPEKEGKTENVLWTMSGKQTEKRWQSLATINVGDSDPVPCHPTLPAFKWPAKYFHVPSGWHFQLGQQGLLHAQAT